MQISSGKVVSIDYHLTNDKNDVIDSSKGRDPLAYLHGNHQIIPGLEKALEGKKVGDSLDVKIAPEEGYGLRDDAKIAVIPLDRVQGVPNLKEGMQLQSDGPQGPQIVTVTKIEGNEVTIDGNHPLAGENLNFAVTVRDIREATPEEVAHGHVHGPGGHHH